MYACMYVYAHVCIYHYVHFHLCICHNNRDSSTTTFKLSVDSGIFMYVCMNECMHVRPYVLTYVCVSV